MKSTMLVLLGILLLCAFPATVAAQTVAVQPNSAAAMVIGFTGGSTWTSQSSGICIWYFPVLGDLDLKTLFATDNAGNPVVDKEHAYLIWVSDWSIQAMFGNPGFPNQGITNTPLSLAVVPAGTATIYYSNNPLSRDWSNLANRHTWGVPVATFVRGAGLFQTDNNWTSDKFYFTAPLTSSKSFSFANGRRFNFKDLVPIGMTCFEYGAAASSSEAGSCMAIGVGGH